MPSITKVPPEPLTVKEVVGAFTLAADPTLKLPALIAAKPNVSALLPASTMLRSPVIEDPAPNRVIAFVAPGLFQVKL